MASGKLIVVEGLDGSGKATQTQILFESMKDSALKISYPDYSKKSSALVQMYLSGEIGTLNEVNAYAASSFYAADRYISYKTSWSEQYKNGYTIVADRYTTSNAYHQMTKLPSEQWEAFLEWLTDYEYNKLGLPIPDLVLYLDMQPAVSKKLIEHRYSVGDGKKDIHEKDFNYLLECRKAAHYVSNKLDWKVVPCCNGDNPYSQEFIAGEIRKIIMEVL